MRTFEIEGMTCTHCERAVTSAIQGVDPSARVVVDVAAGLVRTESDAAPARLIAAMAEAGYPAAEAAEIGPTKRSPG